MKNLRIYFVKIVLIIKDFFTTKNRNIALTFLEQ